MAKKEYVKLLLLLLLLKFFKHGSHSAFADFQWAVYTI